MDNSGDGRQAFVPVDDDPDHSYIFVIDTGEGIHSPTVEDNGLVLYPPDEYGGDVYMLGGSTVPDWMIAEIGQDTDSEQLRVSTVETVLGERTTYVSVLEDGEPIGRVGELVDIREAELNVSV